ncbi:MAG: UbiX family flavin prenyltransferase [Oscillospiraceae bacterium]|jgi:4-hydroxy-3-polyprenylbenzoate decarboxylase|nr:UbiX family flavin prenyltransferase [Oscillospiraceae bacterium]MDD3260786.1 UbiX family flavin prenyltransferase [Oscillospiraceae bacterium]
MRIAVGITGASGSIYGYALVRALAQHGVQVAVVLSDMGAKVMQYECGIGPEALAPYAHLYRDDDLFADVASGSAPLSGMVIAPCSMNTLSCVAGGSAQTLLTRMASVTLKEQRKLVVLVREAPLNVIQLENMTRLARAGACIFPASPGFYARPTEIWQLVQQIVLRIIGQFGIETENPQQWKGGEFIGHT